MSPSSTETFAKQVAHQTFASHGSREITSPTQLRDPCERAQVINGVRGVLDEVDPEHDWSGDLSTLLGQKGDGVLDGNRLTREEFSLDGKRSRVCVLYVWSMADEVHGALFLPGKRELLCTMRGGEFEALPRDLGEELWDAHRTWPEETEAPAKKPAKAAEKKPAKAAEVAAPFAFKTLTAASKKQFTSRVTGKTLARCGERVIRSSAQLTDQVERVQVLNGVAAVLSATLDSIDPGWASGYGLRKIFREGDDALLDEPKILREDFSLAGSTSLLCTLYTWTLGDNEHGALFLPGTGQPLYLLHDDDLTGPRTVGEAIAKARRLESYR